MANHFHSLPPNSLAEQVEVLKALIDGKKLYFYTFDSARQVMQVSPFVGTMPNFGLYHYDTHGTALQKKQEFWAWNDKSFGGTSVKINTSGIGLPKFRAWFDEMDYLNIELLDATVVVHNKFIKQKATPIDAILPASYQVEQLVNKIRNAYRVANRRFRTAQPDPTGKFLTFNVSDLTHNNAYAILKLSDCVLVSITPVEKNFLRRFKLGSNEVGVIDRKGETVIIRNIKFRRFVPGVTYQSFL